MSIPDQDHVGRACCGGRDDGGRHDVPGRPGHRVQGTRLHAPGPAGPAERLVGCTVHGTATVRSRAEADGHVRVVAGMRYYFCCSDCLALFDADPLAYVPAA